MATTFTAFAFNQLPESFEGNQEEFWSTLEYISALELWMSYAMTVKPVHNSDSDNRCLIASGFLL